MKNIVKMEKKKVNLYKNQYKLYSPDIPQPTSHVCNFTMQFKNFALLNSTKKPYEKRKSFSPSVYALKSYGRLQTKNSKVTSVITKFLFQTNYIVILYVHEYHLFIVL